MGAKYWIKTGIQSVDELYAIDGDGNPITGILNGQWVKVLYNPSGIDVSGTITVTVAELGDGVYRVTFTPNVDGSWVLVLENVANDIRFSSGYQAGQNTFDDLATDIAALNDLSIADVQTALTNQGYTTVRAVLLDNLDATISSVLSAIGSLNDLSIADVQTALTNQGYTTARAIFLDNLDATISSVLSAIGSLNDLSQADVQAAMTAQGYTTARALLLDNLDAAITTVIADIAALNDLSIADVQAALTNQGYTTARAVFLDNLDATISSVLTAIAALNDLSQSDIQTALTAQGYTSARAAMIELAKQMLINRLELEEGDSGNWILYADDDITPLLTFDVTDKDNVAVFLPSRAPARRTRGT